MADRVVVMTRRPGTIREVVPVEIPRPRDYHVKFTPEFSELKGHLTELIRQESSWDALAE
jgi:ABC-type nitrate/sulfonate/bicarbonate transport system ATPase subunit